MTTLPQPLVCLITPGDLTPDNFLSRKSEVLDLVRLAAASYIPLVQIREKRLTGRQLFELSEAAVGMTRGSRTRVLVNDRLDAALAAGADGVHLPGNGFRAEDVRRIVPEDFIIGVSAHSEDGLRAASAGRADFAFLSPVFGTPGKGPAMGLEEFRRCVDAVTPFPVVALGGIDGSNYADVLEAGAAGFAAIRFLSDAANLRRLAAEFFEMENGSNE